jgi:hypothetical protein
VYTEFELFSAVQLRFDGAVDGVNGSLCSL